MLRCWSVRTRRGGVWVVGLRKKLGPNAGCGRYVLYQAAQSSNRRGRELLLIIFAQLSAVRLRQQVAAGPCLSCLGRSQSCAAKARFLSPFYVCSFLGMGEHVGTSKVPLQINCSPGLRCASETLLFSSLVLLLPFASTTKNIFSSLAQAPIDCRSATIAAIPSSF